MVLSELSAGRAASLSAALTRVLHMERIISVVGSNMSSPRKAGLNVQIAEIVESSALESLGHHARHLGARQAAQLASQPKHAS
jgi:hypothetical protein